MTVQDCSEEAYAAVCPDPLKGVDRWCFDTDSN